MYSENSIMGGPGAALLDIRNAYSRVNGPIMWEFLKKLSMPEENLIILKGLHESTRYKVTGRESMSEDWLLARRG